MQAGTMSPPTSENVQEKLASIRGQSIILPDLHSMFKDWPKKINPELEYLRSDVEAWLIRSACLKALLCTGFLASKLC